MVDPEDKAFKSDLESPIAMDLFEIHPVIAQKQKQKIQDRLGGVPPDQGPLPKSIYI